MTVAGGLGLVDCDVHPTMPDHAIMERLSARSRRHVERYGWRTPTPADIYPRVANGGMRLDAWPDKPGAIPGSDPELLCRQLLDEYGIGAAVLNCINSQECFETPALADEVSRLINDWLAEDWLDADPRLLASIVVPHEYPELAVREIERRAADDRWVQVLMPINSQGQLGTQRYWPIYEAAVAHGLTVGFHVGGYGTHPGVGWPSYYLEEHAAFSVAMQGLLLGLVCNGVFEELPGLKVVLTEGGSAWAAPLGTAIDHAWSMLRDDVPDLQRRPSEYVHEHVWHTTQPIEEPEDPAHLLRMVEHGRLTDRLLFSSDYPHWDFDSPKQALPRALPAEVRERVFAANARELYSLPRVRTP